jgi:hypothetical protein
LKVASFAMINGEEKKNYTFRTCRQFGNAIKMSALYSMFAMQLK